jgi:hypothetical protein
MLLDQPQLLGYSKSYATSTTRKQKKAHPGPSELRTEVKDPSSNKVEGEEGAGNSEQSIGRRGVEHKYRTAHIPQDRSKRPTVHQHETKA